MDWNILYDQALRIAIEAHRGQKDKAGRDYVMHPIRVAERCSDPRAKIVALLHDVLEDTDVTADYLRSQGFPEEIVDAVLAVTKREGEPYEAFVHRAAQNPLGKQVKKADLEDNMDIRRLNEITDDDVSRLRKYLRAWQSILSLTIAIVFSSLLFVSCVTQEERAARKAERVQKVTAALNARKYVIDITRMIPSKGPAKSVSSYSIEVRNDSLISYLPYIGRAYSVPYGGGNGLNFSAPISNYKESIKKNGMREIEISVTNSEDTYVYRLGVFDNGSSSLDVQSRQREQISYTGDMVFK